MSRPDQPNLDTLTELVARLRAPDGCPWDREQTVPDLRAYLLEEAHEVAAAIDHDDWQSLAGELGDLLFQIVFLAALAAEAGEFSLHDVVERIRTKMIARHPHVFGDENAATAAEVRAGWERRKLAEASERKGSLLDGVAPTVPALLAAYRLTQKAAGVGFDWASPVAVRAKLNEELDELDRVLPESGAADLDGSGRGAVDRAALGEELGDVLFTTANLARHLGVDPEAALARSNDKFRRRFSAIESRLSERGDRLAEAATEELEELWQEVKREEAASRPEGVGSGPAEP